MLIENQMFLYPTCCEQIIEKARDKSLYLNFIDFCKAFDCIHRDTLWAILLAYGLPEKIINIITSFYTGSRSTVRVNGSLGEWFDKAALSPLLFAVAIDWAMKRAVETASGSGRKWTEGDNVTDLDFADDMFRSMKQLNSCKSLQIQ